METAFETKAEVAVQEKETTPVASPKTEEKERTPIDASKSSSECSVANGEEIDNSEGSGDAAREDVSPDGDNSSEELLSDAKEASPEATGEPAEGPELGQTQVKGKSSESPTKPKSKKKEDKSIEHILRALNSLSTTEEKLAALCKKYADLHEEHRVLQTSFKQSQRKMTVVTREKVQLQMEHTKAVMAKSKLESLCRELQKHNRLIKEESLTRAREEDEKRKEISNKFQTTIGEIQTQMTDNHERNTKLREENADLATKLKNFIEQYELREQQVEKIMKHRELEKQLADAKLAQANAIMAEQEERGKKEKELLILQATESQKKAQVLETQLTMYKERYEEFQSTINRSNDMFQKFKTEMDKMTKRIKKLEKEGASWRAKWETSNKALLEVTDQKKKVQGNMSTIMTKCSKLESLCRALQAELHGKKPTPVPASPETNTTNTSTPSTPPNTPEKQQTPQENPSEATKSSSPVKKGKESVTLPEGADEASKADSISNVPPSPDSDKNNTVSEVVRGEFDDKDDRSVVSNTADSPDQAPVGGAGETPADGSSKTTAETPVEKPAETPVEKPAQTPVEAPAESVDQEEQAVPSDYNIADVD
ncbi:alpha-taxilin-like [Gigantopelta aegis]|uniref:alpha-taxilin-like n=1 Tax=Gigantopelta aegis TaxID=1735272 RepID=UPI001B88AA69|nr:alpha-taxilin-like [Gigantopelta aegis]